MRTIWLRIIYASHMIVPLSLVRGHIERLDGATALALRSLFP